MTAALANAVLDVLLGEYIEGLDQRQLELDVLNGHLLLQNLTIRSTAIQRALQLPVAVKAGIIGRVELRIPWAHLSSQPTQLRMRNLLLLVGCELHLQPCRAPSGSHAHPREEDGGERTAQPPLDPRRPLATLLQLAHDGQAPVLET